MGIHAEAKSLDELLWHARLIALDPLPYVQRWRAESPGRRVVASEADPFPAELVDALGMLHVDVAPECSKAHRARPIPYDALVVDQRTRPISDDDDIPTYRMRPGTSSVEDWSGELSALTPFLERACGRRLTPLYLRASLHHVERQRRLVLALLRLRDESPEVLSLSETYCLIRLGSVLPRRHHGDLLSHLLPRLEGRLRRRRPATRVVLIGPSSKPLLELFDSVEACGLHVVHHEQLRSARFSPAPRRDGEPIAALCELLAEMTAQRDRAQGRHALLRWVRDRRADAVLFACDDETGESPPDPKRAATRALLDEAGVPHETIVWTAGADQNLSADSRHRLEELANLGRAAA